MLLFGIHPLWFGLNLVRALSIATLALVIAVNIVVMIRDANSICREMNTRTGLEASESNNKPSIARTYIPSSTVPLQPGGPFFAILSRLLIDCQCLILILAELEWPKELFTKFLPILGPGHGVGILGTMQVLLSAVILSHHIPKFVLVPGLLLFGIGSLNITLGLIFRNNIHLHRARATDGLNDNHSEDTRLFNRRTSFRPGGERPVTQSSAVRSTIPTDLEKPPSYRSKGDRYGYSEMPVYYGRSPQQWVEKGGESIPFPEQARSKY
ncbi:unnamed protein product [Rhizoctonia solani]|uniref:DUF7598 domain-containing protein n=1 Tax=Rhizoctonia solani TaxID=456999 RepID=A0A8H2WMG9_9AGAM|nr:unnamed protein product [Rhizoctonia solani]